MSENAAARLAEQRPGTRRVLHVGCGPADPRKLNRLFHEPGWTETRLDIDPAVQPDIVGSITSMPMIGDDSVDAVWSSHNLEHLFAHEVPVALREFNRVLKPGGLLLITLPDLQAVAKMIAEGDIERVLMSSRDGTVPITPLDVVFGWGWHIARGRVYMAHRTGFTGQSLAKAIVSAGFPQAQVARGKAFDLWALSFKGQEIPDQTLLRRAVG